MAFDFPASPTVGQTYSPAAGILYTWNGYAWAAQTSSTGTLTKIVPFTASGTYTPSAGLVSAIVECVGGGGGGGGVFGNAGFGQGGGGGGSGGYSRRALTAAQIGASQSITIGAFGAGGAAGANSGSAGGDTYMGASLAAALCGAKGGSGGVHNGSTLPGTGGAGGVTTGAVGDITAAGAPGESGLIGTTAAIGARVLSGGGGSSALGGGSAPVGGQGSGSGGAGNAAGNYGSGGSGGAICDNTTSFAGGAGSAGVVIVTEFIAVTATAAPGFPVQIARVDVSTPVATVAFTTGIDATYDEYEFHYFNVQVTGSSAAVALQISQDGGTTWKAGASDYQFGFRLISSTAGQSLDGSVAGAAFMQLTSNIATPNSLWPLDGTVKFARPYATGGPRNFFRYENTVQNAGATSLSMHVGFGAYQTDGNAFNAVRFMLSVATTFAAGTFVLYGIKK